MSAVTTKNPTKYRLKNSIEAFYIENEEDLERVVRWGNQWQEGGYFLHKPKDGIIPACIVIPTPTGPQYARVGDYVIRRWRSLGAHNVFEVLDPMSFSMMYEPLDEGLA